ncbi:MAG: lamin tail domain-containing protein [Balneolales bacterium]|nr:lamin tail domain-containing protein [Balneolales bacterium]
MRLLSLILFGILAVESGFLSYIDDDEMLSEENIVRNEISLTTTYDSTNSRFTYSWNYGYDDFPGDVWLGESIRFEVDDGGDGVILRQIGDPQNNSHYLYLMSEVYYGEWSFSVQFDGFATSNQNRVWVWLQIDDPESPNGYAVRIGESGGMKFARLFRMRGESNPVEILQSARVLPDDNAPFHVKVERQQGDVWRMGVQTAYDMDYVWSETIHQDDDLFVSNYFGFRTHFTSTRADRFLFGPVQINKFPLHVKDIQSTDSGGINITFSEPISDKNLTVNDIRLIDVRSGLEVETSLSLHIDGYSARLFPGATLPGGTYRLEISSFNDNWSGSQLPGISKEFTVYDSADLFDVVINEFTPRVEAYGTPRFIELINRSDKLLNLQNWEVGRQQQSSKLIGVISLFPEQKIVISTSPMEIEPDSGSFHLVQTLPAFGRNQDIIWIRDNTGSIIDSLAYTTELTGQLSDGVSLERRNPDQATMDYQNWSASIHQNGHSAGLVNTVRNQSLREVELLKAFVSGVNSIEINFNTFVEPSVKTFISMNGLEVVDYEWSPWEGDKISLNQLDLSSWLGSSRIELQIERIRAMGSVDVVDILAEVAQVAHPGDIIINEIMYQPLQGRYDAFSDQSEYIEFQNLRPYSISLDGTYIRDTIDKNGVYRSWESVDNNWIIHGNDYAVLYADTASSWEDTRIYSYFGNTEHNKFARVDRSTLGLTSSGRGVYLSNRDGQTIDSVYYSPEWHHPFVTDARGRSLERITTPENHNGVQSFGIGWSTSASKLGGTPGLENSIHFKTEDISSSREGLKIEPNPFSPDLDGQQDHAVISFRPPETGYLVRMRIFDRYGRLINTLVNDQLIGNSLNVIWDGRDRNNNLMKTGVYIVHVEAVHPHQRNKEYKKTIVLVRKS